MMTTEAKYIFWVYFLNGKSFDHETWQTNRYTEQKLTTCTSWITNQFLDFMHQKFVKPLNSSQIVLSKIW